MIDLLVFIAVLFTVINIYYIFRILKDIYDLRYNQTVLASSMLFILRHMKGGDSFEENNQSSDQDD